MAENESTLFIWLVNSVLISIITIILVVLKLCGIITDGWVIVFLPLISYIILIVLLIFSIFIALLILECLNKKHYKHNKDNKDKNEKM